MIELDNTIKSYLNLDTRTVHLVGLFPAPKRNGFVQCGQHQITHLYLVNPDVTKIVGFKFCKGCMGYLGMD